MSIPDHLTCLLRNLYADQETTVTTGHGTMDWFKIGKGVRESIPKQVDEESGALEKEKGVRGSQGGEKDKRFIYTALSQSIKQCILLKDMFLLNKN